MKRKDVINITGKRKTKIKTNYRFNWLVRIFNYKHREFGKITTPEFRKIIETASDILIEKLFTTSELKFPYRLGYLCILKVKPTLKYVDGKLINRRPIIWSETVKLWEEDEEAWKKKLLIRSQLQHSYILKYTKIGAVFNNKRFFKFKVNRNLTNEFSRRAIEGSLEGFKNIKL